MTTHSRTPGPLLDVGVLLGRSLRHSVRSIDATITAIVLPLLILMVFVYIFAGHSRRARRTTSPTWSPG